MINRQTCAATMIALLVFAVAPSRAQDKSTYYTVMHPKEFTIDWKGFYTRAEEMTAETRKELPNKLNIAYGSDPKQQLDVYRLQTEFFRQPSQTNDLAPVFRRVGRSFDSLALRLS